jgi:glycosyltransferase involved in cell wall biosynthesis
LGIDSKRKTILFFGAIRDNKGLEEILKALPRIRKGVPEVMLLIVGEAIQGYEKYRDLIRILEIEGSVMEVLRYVSNEEIATFFYATDVVVLPYREVSQSGVLQIAYAFGLPVVATAVGGFLEAIEDGKNGFLVPPQALDLLADRVAKVLSDDERAEAMGRHSLFLAKTMYSWKEIAERTEALYQLLEERKG